MQYLKTVYCGELDVEDESPTQRFYDMRGGISNWNIFRRMSQGFDMRHFNDKPDRL